MFAIFKMIDPYVIEVIGVIGFAIYVGNYALLTFRFFSSDDLMYFFINLIAASCVLVGLAHSFNLASALIQLFWIVISAAAIVVRLMHWHRSKLSVFERRLLCAQQQDSTVANLPAHPVFAHRTSHTA